MRSEIRNLAIITLCAGTIFSQACKKDTAPLQDEHYQQKMVNPSLVYKTPETAIEKELVLNLEKITAIIKEVYKNKEALKEANAAIQAGIYTDESILLKDLIFLDNGILDNSKSFKALRTKLSINQGAFSAAFWKVVEEKNDSELKSFLNRLNANGTTSIKKGGNQTSTYEPPEIPLHEITLYFPYSHEFINPYDNSGNYSPQTSIMTATADADEGYGWAPVFDLNGNMGYAQVLINDDYAYINPTHILGINGIDPVVEEVGNTVLIFPPGPPIQVPNLPRTVHQVFIGEVKCTEQYDKLISFTGNGGGSEIRFTRADGFLKQVDGQVQQADVYIIDGKLKMERGDIRKGNWVDWTVMWDADWESENKEQNLAIYEDDNRNSQTLTVSVKTTVKIDSNVASEGTVGGTLNFKSDDEIIRQNNHKFETFFPTNRFASYPDVLQNGWLVYGTGGTVSFTLPDKKLIQ